MAIQSNHRRGGARPGAGRPLGSKNKIVPTPLPASLRDPGRLGSFKGREVPAGAEPDLYEQINWARSQIARCAAGEFGSKRAPTILRAASALLDEALGKLREKVEHSGRLDLAAALDAIEGEKTITPPARRAVIETTPAPALPPPVEMFSDEPDHDRLSDREPPQHVASAPGCHCHLSGLAMGRHHGDCPIGGTAAMDRPRRVD